MGWQARWSKQKWPKVILADMARYDVLKKLEIWNITQIGAHSKKKYEKHPITCEGNEMLGRGLELQEQEENKVKTKENYKTLDS